MSTTPEQSARVRTAVKAALGTTVAVPLMFAAMPATAQSNAVQELRQEINQLQHRLDMLESQQQQSSSNGIQLGETDVDISGFVRLDSRYDFEHDMGSTLLPSDVVANGGLNDYGNDEDADFGTTAAWSRLRISTTTPTAMGDVGGYIEADFWGDGDGGGSLRLRQAYLTWGHWLVGKAWTTFANFHYGTMVNFAGPAGQVFGRLEQVRYTVNLGGGSNFSIALENPQLEAHVQDSKTSTPDLTDITETSTPLPQLVMRYRGSAGIFSYQAAALARELKAENGAGHEDEAFSWGANLGGTLSFATGTTLMLSAAYGEGIGADIYHLGFGSNVAWFEGSSLETNEVYGLIGTISQKLTDKLTTNVVYGYSHVKAGSNDAEGSGTSLAVNLMWAPVKPLVFGVEYARVTADVDDGPLLGVSSEQDADGDANRIGFVAIYNF